MNATTHCDRCGMKTAVLVIQGELSGQYICQTCDEMFERDIPMIEKPRPIETVARYQGLLSTG